MRAEGERVAGFASDAWVGRKVALDPSVADWQPRCVSCEQPVTCWNNAVALPAASNGIEDDEPDCLVVAHVVCPAPQPPLARDEWADRAETAERDLASSQQAALLLHKRVEEIERERDELAKDGRTVWAVDTDSHGKPMSTVALLGDEGAVKAVKQLKVERDGLREAHARHVEEDGQVHYCEVCDAARTEGNMGGILHQEQADHLSRAARPAPLARDPEWPDLPKEC